MQITLDLPDDLYSDALAVAKRDHRSLASVVQDLIRQACKAAAISAGPSGGSDGAWKLPVVKGARRFTEAEIDQMLEADGLPCAGWQCHRGSAHRYSSTPSTR